MKAKWKQNGKKKQSKGNAVLQKYMVAVGDFVKNTCGAEEDEGRYERGLSSVKKKSRKELRREKRKLKKARMKKHYEGKKGSGTLSPGGGDRTEKPGPQGETGKEKKRKKKDSAITEAVAVPAAPAVAPEKPVKTKKKGQKASRLQESRKMALLEANEEEDREIKKLERCLGLNKRKNKKNIPQSFVADGLDYILGLLDSGSSAGAMFHDDDNDVDVAKEKFERLGEEENDGGVEQQDNDEDMLSMEDDDDDNYDEDEEEEEEEEEVEEEEEEEEMVDEEEPEEEEKVDEEEEVSVSRTPFKAEHVDPNNTVGHSDRQKFFSLA